MQVNFELLLQCAAAGSDTGAIRLLLSKEAIDPMSGGSALLTSVAVRNHEAVQLLLDKGCNVDSRDLQF